VNADIVFLNHGSIFLLRAETPVGEEWLSEHISPDAMTWGGSIVVEPRYVDDIAYGAADAGLTVGAQ
jgi:hypothetical protein